MRIKKGPGKPRLFHIPPKPSIMAFNSPSTQLNSLKAHSEQSDEANEDDSLAHRSIVQETCEDADENTTCHKQTHVAIDNMVVEKYCHRIVPEVSDGGKNRKKPVNDIDGMAIEEKSHNKVSESINGQIICSKINLSEKQVCIKCDKGGKLLVCSNNRCPLAVHEECMRCSAHFDSKGNFFCPYCLYKQAVLTERRAKKKTMLEKKALSVFLDKSKVDGGQLNEKVDSLKSREKNLPETEEVVPCDGATSSAINEENNVTGKNIDSGRTVDGRKQTEKIVGTEQAHINFQEKNPKHIDDFQNKIGQGQGLMIRKKRMLSVEPGISFKSSPIDGETEAEEGNQKNINGFRSKRVKRHDQETPLIGKSLNLGVVSEESMDESLDTETEEEENSKIADEVQNKALVMEKNKKLDVELEKYMEGNLENSDTEEEEIQDRGQESSGDDYSEENDEVVSDSSNGITKRSSRRNRYKSENATTINGECSRQTSRKLSFEGDKNMVQKENTRSDSRQPITNTGFPIVTRKRVPWTAEEEEMLKQGVMRFLSTGYINIPWKKILDFGGHVFHGVRTAEHLRDKWRNQMKQA